MTARAALRALLKDDTRLNELGFETVYGQNAVDTPAEQRFVVIRWQQPRDRTFAQKAPDVATVWFHDTDRDYTNIDLALERVKEIVRDAVHVSTEDGWTITQVDWETDGPDLADDGYNTVVRWSELTVISRYDGPN